MVDNTGITCYTSEVNVVRAKKERVRMTGREKIVKKILFIIPTFNHGGSNRHIFNILRMIDWSKYQIDIFGIVDTGPYRKLLSTYNVLPGNFITTGIFQQFDSIKKENIFIAAAKTLIKILYRLTKLVSEEKAYKLFVGKALDKLGGYDTVVAVEEGTAT